MKNSKKESSWHRINKKKTQSGWYWTVSGVARVRPEGYAAVSYSCWVFPRQVYELTRSIRYRRRNPFRSVLSASHRRWRNYISSSSSSCHIFIGISFVIQSARAAWPSLGHARLCRHAHGQASLLLRFLRVGVCSVFVHPWRSGRAVDVVSVIVVVSSIERSHIGFITSTPRTIYRIEE